MSRTKLVMLGTGTPSLVPNRYQSSTALIVDDQPYLIDCGSGSLQRQMDARGRPYHVHTPTFRIDESALAIGTASLVAAAAGWMQQKGF